MRTLIISAAIVLLIVGLFWPLLGRIPLFRLPGDIVINRPGMKVYIPITSMVILTLLLSLLLRFLR
jgi:hypothetical protein